MKKKLQKGLSLMLVFSLLMSLMSMSGFAVGSDDATSAQQIVANGQESSYADGKVKVSKMISGTNAENVFDITLNVETTQSYDTIIVTPPAAVALVIDTSASMDAQVPGVEDGKTVTKTRLYWAKKAAAEFLEEFADPNGAARYVSLSEFYRVGYAKSSGGQYWFNVSDATERAKLVGLINSLVCENHSGTNVEAGLLMAEDLLNDSPVKNLEHKFLLVLSDGAPNAVSTAMPSGGYVAGEYNGTYNNNPEWDKTKYDSLPLFDDWAGYSGGGKEIYVPNNVPDGSEEHEDKVDTMDNDGYYMGWYWKSTTNGTGGNWPNWPNSGTPATTWEKVEMTGYSNPYLYAAYRAYKAAQDIGATIPIYTLNYGSAGEQIGANEANWNFSTNYSVSDWLKYHIASKPDNAFGRGDSDDVAELFTSILGEIKEELAKYAQAWTVTDPMGERVEYMANSAATNDGSVSYNNGTLTWTLADPAQRVDGNKTYYTYSATYQVKLDNVTPGSDSLAAFAEGNVYATNGTTTLTYWLMVDENGSQYYVDENGAKINGDPSLTANFVVPSVKGYLADLTFKKVNEEKAALAGAVFTLSGENGFSQEATSDENGTVSFTGIPSGYSYTLAEKTAPDGYDKTESTYTVTVSYDTVSVAGVSDLANFQIANQKTYVPVPPKHTITATKVVDGATLAAGQFSFQLLDAQGNVLQTKTNEADGSVTFDEIDYATAGVGTYTYTVKEFVPASVPENWTYDNTEYTVIVVVNQDADTGEYSKAVTVNGVENGPISFTNSYYVPQHERGSITVTKVTSGNTTPDTATFQLQKQNADKTWSNVDGQSATYADFRENAETSAMEYTFANLTEGTYRVVETNADGISNYSWTVSYGDNVELVKTPVGSKGDTQVSSGAITVTNTYTEHKGSLKITKTITGLSDAQKAELAEKLVFTVTGPNNYSATVAYKDFNNGMYVMENLPVGTYEVTENVADAQVEGYHLAYTYNNNSSAANASAQVQNGKIAEATIANVYTELPPTSVSGQFSINFDKDVSGDAYALNGNDFAFNLTDSGNNAITGYNDANGNVTIAVPFTVDLASETGNTATRTFNYMLSEQAGSVEGMTYSTAQYPISVEVTFSRTSNLAAWTWAVTNVTANGAEDSISGAAITLNRAGGAALFINQYKMPTGTLTINKRAAGDNTSIPEKTAFIVKNESGEVVKTVYYKEFQHGSSTSSYTMNLPAGKYTVTEDFDSAQVDGYKLKVDGGPTAEATVIVGNNAYVGFTNNYELVPYAYKVVHEYYFFLNGSDKPSYVGANGGKEYYAKVAPGVEAVYKDQVAFEDYQKATYNKGELKDVSVTGNFTEGTLVYTVKYYRSNWTVGALTIEKDIIGLDTAAERDLKDVLSFVVTAPDGNKTEIKYSEFKNGKYTLYNLTPGTYTVEEKGAEVGGGYDLTVVADDENREINDGYQVEVEAGASATTFSIQNEYTSRIYNIWFNGGAHGDVKVNDKKVTGVYRNRVLEFTEIEEVTWDPTNLPNRAADHLYQIDNDAVIYPNIGMGPQIIEEYGYVMYTFTWADYVNYKNHKAGYEPYYMDPNQVVLSYDLGITAPKLNVEEGWESNEVFYRNGSKIPFSGIDAAVEYMNSAVQPDADGVYNVLYVPAYTEEVVPYGNLTINKIATGADVPAGATFTITDEAGTTTINAKYVDFENGSYTFENIPVGNYTVTETNAGVSEYTLTTTVNYGEGATSAAVVENGTAVVSITNTYTFNGGGGGGGGSIIIPKPPVIEIPEEDVPLVDIPDEEIPVTDLPEEDVPLADVPKTGDATALWMALNALSGTALAGVSLLGRKKREDEEI